METVKLYYENAFLQDFTAVVESCGAVKGGFAVVLDRTAFYPEGGGQPADHGTLGDARVLDVHEKDGVVAHLCDRELPVGAEVSGHIDWARRFDHMQQHSGEHIVSGMLCSAFHCDNVGFHMGADVVTIDFNADIPWEELLELEAAANRYIYEDHAIDIQLHRGADAVGKAARTAEVFPRIAADQPRHCQRLYIVRRAVSGRIVHQQHRKALHGLGTQGGQALLQQRQTVVGHDDGRDISCVKHLFSGRICA